MQAGASNVILTLVRHQDLLKAWLGLGERLLFSNRVTPRERELVVLHVALQTEAEYGWANHGAAACAAGISEDEIQALVADTGAWPEADAAVVCW